LQKKITASNALKYALNFSFFSGQNISLILVQKFADLGDFKWEALSTKAIIVFSQYK